MPKYKNKEEEALVNLLYNLGWATAANNPEGRFLEAQLDFLRKSIRNAYKILGYSEEELNNSCFIWKRQKPASE